MEKIQIVTPVYNEEKNIYSTLENFFEEYKDNNFEISFIISEDGSTDNSINIINDLKKVYDIKLLSSPDRKNYSEAVLIGLRETTSKIISFVDSDGQYDPKDLKRLYEKLEPGEIVIGYRFPRIDNIFRLFISGSFKKLYELLLNIKLKDPSCGYFMAYKEDIESIIHNDVLGLIQEGFWWEFYAWCIKRELKIIEIPIKHFNRKYDNTVVFKLNRIPGIAYRNILGLFKLRKIIKNT